MTQAANPPASASPAKGEHHFFWGIAYVFAGVLVGFFWLWGNAVQIQTSEAWILGAHNAVSLSPRIDIFLQVTQLWSGHLTLHQFIAYTWGWLNQVILLAFSLGIEFHHVSGKHRADAWKWGSALFIILNSLADLSYGSSFGGMWQPWVFAGVCFMASFFFGLLAIGAIVKGIKYIFGIK